MKIASIGIFRKIDQLEMLIVGFMSLVIIGLFGGLIFFIVQIIKEIR